MRGGGRVLAQCPGCRSLPHAASPSQRTARLRAVSLGTNPPEAREHYHRAGRGSGGKLGTARVSEVLMTSPSKPLHPKPWSHFKDPERVIEPGWTWGSLGPLQGPTVINQNWTLLDKVPIPLGFLSFSQISFNISPHWAVYTCS